MILPHKKQEFSQDCIAHLRHRGQVAALAPAPRRLEVTHTLYRRRGSGTGEPVTQTFNIMRRARTPRARHYKLSTWGEKNRRQGIIMMQ